MLCKSRANPKTKASGGRPIQLDSDAAQYENRNPEEKIKRQMQQKINYKTRNAEAKATKPKRSAVNNSILVLALLAAFSCLGCGSTSPTKAGPISVTDATGVIQGQLKSLAVGAKANVSMTPANDNPAEGVDWSVTCGGNPATGSISGNSCGSLSPTHTADGVAAVYTAPARVPIGNNVTIKATVTGDFSATSTVVLPIVEPQIAIQFVNTYGSNFTSLGVGSTGQYAVSVSNDITAAAVTWSVSCGSSQCGSVFPANGYQTSYTAPETVPSGGTVTLTATSNADSSVSASLIVTIVPIVVNIAPASVYVQTNGRYRSATLIATTTNDASNAGVTWTLSCGNTSGNQPCGSINKTSQSGAPLSFTGPSTVPPGGTVTITATSVTDPSASATATANVITTAPIVVTLTPPGPGKPPLPATLTVGASQVLTASVANDSNNLGVNWTASCGTPGSCGTFSLSPAQTASGQSITYTAPPNVPAGGVVTITASSPATTPSNSAVAATVITPSAPSITFLQQPPSSMVALGQAPVSAVVTNDVTQSGVTWSTTCQSTVAGGCGYVLPNPTPSGVSAVYTAPPVPPGGTVTIVATAAATVGSSSSVTVSSMPIKISPATALSVRFVPYAPSQLQAGIPVNLNAAVANDSTNAGVNWQVCPSGCGYFTITPAIPAIPATATTPYVPPVPAVTATSVTAWPNAAPISYTPPSTVPPGGTFAITVTAHADGTTSQSAIVTISETDSGPALNGVVRAGTQPVVGSSVSLYAAGTSGYGSAATLLYEPGGSPVATTDASGHFSIAGGYICPSPNSQVYLVALAGAVGGNGPNPNLGLMTALGACGTLSSSPVVLNEVTTVASAWPLAPFEANDSLTGNSSYLNLGTSSGNATGLANAFATVNNLVDITTGHALFNVPAGNAAVPYAEINTLADALYTCTNSSGGSEGDGSACGTFFLDADPLSGANDQIYHPTPPTDTLQAAMNIAQHPVPPEQGSDFGYQIALSDGTGTIFYLPSVSSPFQPILNINSSVLDEDFTDASFSLNYAAPGGAGSALALDGAGNLWVLTSVGNRSGVLELNNQGAQVSPPAGYTSASLINPGALAIDASGNPWICDTSGLTELSSLGTEYPGSPFSGGGLTAGARGASLAACQGIAIDGLGNVWTNNSTNVSKFSSLGVPLSPEAGYTFQLSPTDSTPLNNLLSPMAIDNSGNVWVGVNSPALPGVLSLLDLNGSSGLPYYLVPADALSSTAPLGYAIEAVTTGGLLDQTQIAVDGKGSVWAGFASINPGGYGNLCKVPAYAGAGTIDIASCGYGDERGNGISTYTNTNSVAVDGAGYIWAPSSTVADIVNDGNMAPGVTQQSPSGSTLFAHFNSPSLVNGAVSMAIDSSGNVWVLLQNGTVTEFTGIATPAVTPLAAAVKSAKLGATP